MLALLGPIESAIAQVIVAIHSGLAHISGAHSGWAWALSIVLLVAAIRIVLFPLFAKQSRSMRQMQTLQPKVQELRRRYKDDKQALNEEMMKLYREAGVNPLGGCLPLVVQAPIFYALYRSLYSISNLHNGQLFQTATGFTNKQAREIGLSTLFGTPISAAFNSSTTFLHKIAGAGASVGSPTSVKIVTAAFIVAMSAATFITSRQSMSRNAAMQAQTGTDNPLMKQQKWILYAMPLFLAVFGYRVPLGALIYWLANNVFTMIQQHFLYRRMDAAEAAAVAGAALATSGGSAGASPAVTTPALTDPSGDGDGSPSSGPAQPPSGASPNGQPTGGELRPWQSGPSKSRKQRNRKGGR